MTKKIIPQKDMEQIVWLANHIRAWNEEGNPLELYVNFRSLKAYISKVEPKVEEEVSEVLKNIRSQPEGGE